MPSGAWITADAVRVLLVFLTLMAGALIVGALRRGGRREDPVSDDAVATSRFTLPVSIIVPVDRPAPGLGRTIAALLALNYPELEVIVVGDEISALDLEVFRTEWELTPKEDLYRRSLPTAAVRRIFESTRDERLVVVDKEGAGRADALNCGLSLARFRYVATVNAGVVVDTNALLRLMAPALRDPANVVAATSHVERRLAADERPRGGPLRRALTRVHSDWQGMGSVRSWLASRITIRSLRCGLASQDSMIAWRRDALLESGGFLPGAADPELDLLLRLQTSMAERVSGNVVRTSEIVGRMDPVSLGTAGRLGSLRQRAVIQAAAALRHPQSRTDGRVAALCFVLAELLTPVAQGAVIIAVVAGATVGWFRWMDVALVLVMFSFGNAAVTAAALLVRGAVPGGPTTRELTRLLLLAPVEYVLYRPAVAVRRLAMAVFAMPARVTSTRSG